MQNVLIGPNDTLQQCHILYILYADSRNEFVNKKWSEQTGKQADVMRAYPLVSKSHHIQGWFGDVMTHVRLMLLLLC